MTLLKREDIEHLATQTGDPLVSIYLPTHRAGPETAQDPIRFKNLLGTVEDDLQAQGHSTRTVQSLLAPARSLLDDRDFWRFQSEGLAVFVSDDGVQPYRLPLEVEPLGVVTDHFHVKPLLALLSRDARFHLLALSQNRVRLYEATRDTIREIDLRDVPESLRDALGYDYEERSLQFHTGAGTGAGGKRRAMYHGQGSPRDDDKEEIEKFLRIVDRGVRKLLGEARVPMVLAGVDYLLAIFRSVSDLPEILEEGVEGNPDHLNPEELRERAWPLVEPMVMRPQREALEQFEQYASAGKAATGLEVVLRAAVDGRVATLLVGRDVRVWGRFDRSSRRAQVHDSREPGDRDLVDTAAVECLVKGADVYVVASDRLPGDGAVAAILRY